MIVVKEIVIDFLNWQTMLIELIIGGTVHVSGVTKFSLQCPVCKSTRHEVAS